MFMPEGNYNFKYDRKLILMVGNIGSGKTTYIKNLNQEYVTLSIDKMRYMMGNGDYIFSYQLEEPIWQAELKLFKELIKKGINIVIDEINTNKNMRNRYIYNMLALTWECNKYEVTAVVMPKLSMKESVRRRLKQPHGDSTRKNWEMIWKKFDENYTAPTLEESFNKIIMLDENYKIKEIIE